MLCRGGSGGPAAACRPSHSSMDSGGGAETGIFLGPSGDGEGGKKRLGSERRPWGGGCNSRGELEKTSGVRRGSRGGSKGGLEGPSDTE